MRLTCGVCGRLLHPGLTLLRAGDPAEMAGFPAAHRAVLERLGAVASMSAPGGPVRETVRLPMRPGRDMVPRPAFRRQLSAHIYDVSAEQVPGQSPSRYRIVCRHRRADQPDVDRPVTVATLTSAALAAAAKGQRDVELI